MAHMDMYDGPPNRGGRGGGRSGYGGRGRGRGNYQGRNFNPNYSGGGGGGGQASQQWQQQPQTPQQQAYDGGRGAGRRGRGFWGGSRAGEHPEHIPDQSPPNAMPNGGC